MKSHKPLILLFTAGLMLASCSRETKFQAEQVNWKYGQSASQAVISVTGFNEPEAVRYDEINDVFYVSNFNGRGSEADSNGFISLLNADGEILNKRYLTGSKQYPLHAPRGMYITGNVLWATDIHGLHSFDTNTRRQINFIDFRGFKPGFLNDITIDDQGNFFITDTGKRRIYKLEGQRLSILADSLPIQPNGITFDAFNSMLVLATWGGSRDMYAYDTVLDTLVQFGTAEAGGFFDGIEFLKGALISASQADSSLRIMENGFEQQLLKVRGKPADIAIDPTRMRVAVPYIALNRVDFFDLTHDN
jgi:hypothetical protein